MRLIPRLTLFTGPNCSLCDVAKAALTSVRESHPHTLNTINIQDPKHIKWKRKYVYEIPVLHIDDKLAVKGRWGQSELLDVLDRWKVARDHSNQSEKEHP